MTKYFVIASFFSSLILAGVVTRPMLPDSQKNLRTKLEEIIGLELQSKARVQVENFNVNAVLPKDGSVEITDIQPRPAIGVVNVSLRWVHKGEPIHTVARAVVKVYASVAVSKGNLKHNDTLSKVNVSMEERELTPYRSSGFYTELKAVENLRVNGFLSSGQVIGFHQAREAFFVSQGEMVDLVKETPGLKVVARVKALENGKRNQWIRVENPRSHKILQVRVEGPSEVHLK